MVTDGREAAFVGYGSPGEIADAALALAARWPEASQQARARFDVAFAPAPVRDQWKNFLSSL